MSAEPAPPPGVVEAARRLARSSLALASTRLAILATEIEEERVRLSGAAVFLLCALFCMQIAAGLVVTLLVVAFWDGHRLLALGVLAAVFVVVTLVLAGLARSRLAQRPKLFATTLGELAKDRERLGS